MRVVKAGPLTYRVDLAWSKFAADGPDGEAVAVACDSRDRVYVFLRGPRPVQIFEADGEPVGSWGSGEFVRPHGLFIDDRDCVYCTDDFGHCVGIFDRDGRRLATLGTPGTPSDTGATSIDYRTIRRPGPPFHYPTNAAMSPDGELYVADGYGNARIHRFTSDGTLIASWGEPGAGPGQFQVPHGIAVDAAGRVFVCDRENSRIQVFSVKGEYLAEWTDVARPSQIAFDRMGRAYVAELGFRAGRWPGTGEAKPGAVGGRVSVFDASGTLLGRFGGGDDPCAPGDFFAPHGICVDSHGAIYVAEVAWTAGGSVGRVARSCRTLQKFVPLEGS